MNGARPVPQVNRDGVLKIMVAALTRRRPHMLAGLLKSWGQMDCPDKAEIRCLIVENDDHPNAADTVHAHIPFPNGVAIDYVLEPQQGIPFARNRAAKIAVEGGYDLLVFVDDDEYVAQDWLVKLIAGYRASRAVLLGGPVKAAPPVAGLGLFRGLMYRALVARYDHVMDKANRRASLNSIPRMTIATNNWVAETGLFRDDGIWFDTATRFSGGEDTKFAADVKSAGHVVGWVKDAYVYEIIPKDRLSFAYQFDRACGFSMTSFAQKIKKKPFARLLLLVFMPLKLLEIAILGVLVPLTGGRSLLHLARKTGWLVGRIRAAFGGRSRHYEKTTGF
jgi:glycosyltransferase involved in cell wall biosynthesis